MYRAEAEELVPASLSLPLVGVLQRSALSWIGSCGGAVTLLGNIDAWLSLADWASWLYCALEWVASFVLASGVSFTRYRARSSASAFGSHWERFSDCDSALDHASRQFEPAYNSAIKLSGVPS